MPSIIQNILAAIQWISVGAQIKAKGDKAIADVKAALAANDITADLSILDAMIADDEKQKADLAAEIAVLQAKLAALEAATK